MLKFQAVDPGGIRFLYIEIDEVVIQDIADLYTEGFGVSAMLPSVNSRKTN